MTEPNNLRPDEPVRSIAEALCHIDHGYSVVDIEMVGGGFHVAWSPLNEEDVAAEAMYMGHAARVLEILVATGWTPPAGSPK